MSEKEKEIKAMQQSVNEKNNEIKKLLDQEQSKAKKDPYVTSRIYSLNTEIAALNNQIAFFYSEISSVDKMEKFEGTYIIYIC